MELRPEDNLLPDLRAIAEQRLGTQGLEIKHATERLQHELHVHQIELEVQNEALRRAQVALLESRDRYLDLYDFAPVGYLTTSSSGIIEGFNLTFAQYLGVGRAALIGKPLSLYVQSEHRDRWYLILKNNRQLERQEVAEIGFQRADSSRFHARLDCLFCKGKDGTTPTIRISVVDLGAMSAAQKNLIKDESRYRLLYESMRDAFALVDMSGKLIRFNQAYQELLGYSAEELKGKSYSDLTPKKWHLFEARIIEQEVFCDGESSVYEKEYIHKDGTVFPVELKTVLLKNEEGGAEGMWAVVRDISSRKSAETQLLASESRYRLAMKAIAGFVYDWDMVSNQLVVSEGYAELLGEEFNPKLSIFEWWKHYVHPDDYIVLKAQVLAAVKTKPERFLASYRVCHQDGSWLHVANRSLIVYGENGQAKRIVGSLSNITRRVVAETALRTINDSLEEQVLERSAELRTRLHELHESERFIRATLDEMSPALGVIDADGQIIFKNKTWQDIVENQVDGRRQGQAYSPYCEFCAKVSECLNCNKLNQVIDVMLKGKRKSFSIECECSAPLLSPQPCWIAARVSRFKGDGPIRLVTTYEDITERKLAANEVIRTAKNFKAMLRKAELKQQELSKQIAREIHDELGATLTMLKLGLATTLTQEGLPEPILAKITGMLELANMSLQSVKRVTASLRPSMLDTLGFVAAVNWHAKEFMQMTGIETLVLFPEYIRLSAVDSETTFRIIQEALTNVAKHAKASKVIIAASKTKRSLTITVADNGVGLDPYNLARKNSFGVIGMQERAKHLHGSLVLAAQEAGGTCLRLKIPFVPDSE